MKNELLIIFKAFIEEAKARERLFKFALEAEEEERLPQIARLFRAVATSRRPRKEGLLSLTVAFT